MKLSAKTLAEDIKKVELSAELQKFYDENVKEMVDLYGEDETIDELINKFVEKANAYLDKNAKKDEPKAEPKAEEKPEYKFKYKPGDKLLYQYNKNDIWPILIKRTGEYDYPTPNQPSYFCEKIGSGVGGEFVVGAEELEKKITGKYEEPKAEKQPKPKFKVGDWVKDVTTDKVGGKVLKVEYDKAELVFKYVVLFEDNAKRGGDWYYEYNLAASTEPKKAAVSKAKAEKQPKAKKQPKPAEPKAEPKAEEKPKTEPKAEEKPKKEPEGEAVAKISPEVAIIKRFVNCCKGDKGRETARKILAALQKHIVNKEIRKTSNYAAEIMHIQKALITIVYGKKKPDFDKAEFERLEKIAEAEYQEPVAKLSRSFISLIGKEGVKEKAKSLLKKFKDADVSNPLVAEMIKSLQDYVSGNAETVETTARSLQGIFGLAGI